MSETTLERLRAAAPTLSVGMVTADLSNLGQEIAALEGAGVQAVHFDVMDGVFCPMMTIGPPIVAAVQTSMVKDVHLMVEEPIAKLGAFVAAGADVVTLHVESTRYAQAALVELGRLENANDPARGLVRGIALNPGTPVEALVPLLPHADMVVVLAVNPGFKSTFDPSTGERIATVRSLAARAPRGADAAPILVCADGGVKRDNLRSIAALGPDLIVTGSAVFTGPGGDPGGNARAMLADLASG